MMKWLLKLKNEMDRSDPKTWVQVLPLLFLAAFFITSLLRVVFPYQLSWLEGAYVDHSRWILNGNPLYGPPSVDFTPYFYPPLFPYIAALFMKLLGTHMLVPRLVSLLSTWLTLVLIWKLVKYETGSRFYALTAAGFYAAFYSFVRCFYDMARTDALFVFLMFLGVYILRTSKKPATVYWSAVAFYLAIFAKQQALVVVILMGLILLLENFKKFLKFTITFSVLCLLTFLYFQYTSDGWFIFYIYTFPNSHGFLDILVPLIFRDLLLNAPVLFLIAPYLFFKKGKEGENRDFRSQRRFYLAFFIATFAISWASRSHPGGVENVLMPLLISLSVLGAISLRHLEQDIRVADRRGSYFVALLIAAQFIFLIYNPVSLVPTRAHHQANKKLVDLIASFDGEVLLPYAGYLTSLAGKQTHTHKLSIFYDTSKGKASDRPRRIIRKAFRKAFREKRFNAVIVREKDFFFLQKMKGYYKWHSRFTIPVPLVIHGVQHTFWDVYVPK